jgi:hypothetical protein
LGQLVEEFVQVALARLEGLLQQKKHQQWKSPLALAGEILRSHSMASQEVWVAQLSRTSRIGPRSQKSFQRKLLIYKGGAISVTVKEGLKGL